MDTLLVRPFPVASHTPRPSTTPRFPPSRRMKKNYRPPNPIERINTCAATRVGNIAFGKHDRPRLTWQSHLQDQLDSSLRVRCERFNAGPESSYGGGSMCSSARDDRFCQRRVALAMTDINHSPSAYPFHIRCPSAYPLQIRCRLASAEATSWYPSIRARSVVHPLQIRWRDS
jgi:hypothetical protein